MISELSIDAGTVPDVIGRDDRAMAVGSSTKIGGLAAQRPANNQVERAVFRIRK